MMKTKLRVARLAEQISALTYIIFNFREISEKEANYFKTARFRLKQISNYVNWLE